MQNSIQEILVSQGFKINPEIFEKPYKRNDDGKVYLFTQNEDEFKISVREWIYELGSSWYQHSYDVDLKCVQELQEYLESIS